MDKPRKFRNEYGSEDFVSNSEDGMMAFHLKKAGYKLLAINSPKATAWTNDRRLIADGSLLRASYLRVIKIFNRKKFDKIMTTQR